MSSNQVPVVSSPTSIPFFSLPASPSLLLSSWFDVSTSNLLVSALEPHSRNKSLSSNRNRTLWLEVVRNATWGDCAEQFHHLWIIDVSTIGLLLFGVRLNHLLAMVLLHSLVLPTHLLLLFRQRSPFLRNLLVEIKQALIRRAFLRLFCVELDV